MFGKVFGKVIGIVTVTRFSGYPPDMQLLATETVLQQAEMLAYALTVNTLQ